MSAEHFLSLLDEELVLIEKFKEHINFALSVTQDEQAKAFFTHMLQEEDEHSQAVHALIERVKNPPANSEEPTDGHYQRRDQNVLTVGSLLGQAQ
jgi:rubrerythrin